MLPLNFYETDIYKEYPEILEILLRDNNTKKNIIWATDNYRRKGNGYFIDQPINPDLITGRNSRVIKPRSEKSKAEQMKRSKDNAEVFTPSWMCNKQNNIADNAWFGKENLFNKENNDNTWTPTIKVNFAGTDKTWQEYVESLRMEVACGEAPYIASRYDTVSGNELDLKDRIGLLDRKFRVLKENASTNEEWNEYSIKAIKSVYGYEFQGDNLLIARENILLTYLDYYFDRYKKYPKKEVLDEVAKIISWNFWQMDGLKLVVPFSCHKEEMVQMRLFLFEGEEADKPDLCKGCKSGNIYEHNGKRCSIMDWKKNKKIQFLDLVARR